MAAIAAGLAPLAVQQPAHAYDSVVAMLQSRGAENSWGLAPRTRGSPQNVDPIEMKPMAFMDRGVGALKK